MKKHYYALFKKSEDVIEVEFPDLVGCSTFGKDWEEALSYAEDALAAWLVHADPEFVKEPSTHNQLKHLGEIVPIAVDQTIMDSYQELQRFNVIFPLKTLKKIDNFRKRQGLKRSTFLQKAAEEYLLHHQG
jgi:predicted RNase H-like HicB family nuclease